MPVSEDGKRVYFQTTIVHNRLVPGGNCGTPPCAFLWEDDGSADGALSLATDTPVLPAGGVFLPLNDKSAYSPDRHDDRITPDGGHALVVAGDIAAEQLYMYDAERSTPPAPWFECVSCNPSGTDTGASTVKADRFRSASSSPSSDNRAITDDGRYVFFTTTQSLVPNDVNGPCEKLPGAQLGDCADAYVYDSETGQHSLLSSGTDDSPSFFLNSSPDGSDVYIATRERLSAWDTDNAYDIYDARVGGGFPEPELPEAACVDNDGCKGEASEAPPQTEPGSHTEQSEGNPPAFAPRDCTAAERRQAKRKQAKSKRKLKQARRQVRRARKSDRRSSVRRAKRKLVQAKRTHKKAKRQARSCKRGDA